MRGGLGIGLIAAVLASLAGAPSARPHAEYVGRYVWTHPSPEFGGVSGIGLKADGVHFRVLTDHAYTVTGTLQRDAEGRVTDVDHGPPVALLGDRGEPLLEGFRDSEGLALGYGASFYATFERMNSVVFYKHDSAAAQLLSYAYRLRLPRLPSNEGLESIAVAGDGALFTIPEVSPTGDGRIPVFRLAADGWSHPFDIHVDGNWQVSDASFGPDGRLYVLERDHWPLVGFMTRVRRFTIGAQRIEGEEVILETDAGRHGNLEGIAVWRDAMGATRLTMVSDNDFVPFLPTEIVDYRVDA